jgi:outer membrane protein TolC/preprotein translocase subunit SecF
MIDVVLKYPDNLINSVEDLAAFPVGLGGKILPLKAFGDIQLEKERATTFRLNQRPVYFLSAQLNPGEERLVPVKQAEAHKAFDEWMKDKKDLPVIISFDEPNPELKNSLQSLGLALGLSLVLIILTMVMQLGSLMNSLLVFVAVPLGILGAILSLWIFRSTISLNSLLGLILLSGIAVANSIILVDFMKRLMDQGRNPRAAAVEAATTRLRPILMTSLTTALGMMPMALGHGEGGKILQPLGIAVSGGLWFSMLMTLFVVPSLQMSWAEFRVDRANRRASRPPTSRGKREFVGEVQSVIFALMLIPLLAFGPGGSDVAEAAEKVRPSPILSLDFSQALQKALANSEELKIEESQIRSSEYRKAQSQWALTPGLTLSGESGKVGDPSAPFREGKASLNLNLFRGGADFYGIESSSLDLDAHKNSLRALRFEEEERLGGILLDYIASQMQLQTSRKNLQSRQNYYRVAEQRFSQGYLSRQEVDKLFIDLSYAQARNLDLENQVFDLKRTMARILGDETEINLVWPWKTTVQKLASRAPEFSAENLAQIPSYETQSKRLQAAQATMRSYRGLLGPSVDFQLSYEVQKLDEVETRNPTGLVLVTLPLFNRMQDWGTYRLYNEAAVREEIQLRKLERDLKLSYEKSRQDFLQTLASVQARDKTMEISQRLYDDNLKRFQAGRATVNDILVDQDRVTDAETLAIEGWKNTHMSFLKFCHLLGHTYTECL